MTQYVHHIPGRLRLKFEQLKKRPDLSKTIEMEIGKIAGVTSVEARAITGSLLIRYDADAFTWGKLLPLLDRVFHKNGLALRQPPQHRHTDAIAEKLVDMMVEKCIERSAIILLGALL